MTETEKTIAICRVLGKTTMLLNDTKSVLQLLPDTPETVGEKTATLWALDRVISHLNTYAPIIIKGGERE